MSTPLVSVVVAVYNGGKYIAATLESIIEQTYTNWECIIVDDGSNDNTVVIVENYIDKDFRFKIIKTEGGNGPYIAANIGIKEAKGYYIARSDADDVSLPERLAEQVCFLNQNQSVNLCGSLHYYLFEDDRVSFKPYQCDVTFLKWQLIFRNRIVHSTMMFRKDWIKKIGYYPEKRLAQDWYLWKEAVSQDSLYILSMPLVQWRIHQDSITNKENKSQLKAASEVAVANLHNQFKIVNFNPDVVTYIVASIRGEETNDVVNIGEVMSFLKQLYCVYKMQNGMNSKIQMDLHFIVDICFAKSKKTGFYPLFCYLKTITFAGFSVVWLKGLTRQLFKLF